MGGLSHYIEAEGIATTQISLIREHTETMKPPRALWVTFPLGRPLGNPNDPNFQRDVLKHALALLECSTGPVLHDYPHDCEDSAADVTSPACPVHFMTRSKARTSSEKLLLDLLSEIAVMRTWYDIACEKTCRSTTGLSGLTPEEITGLYEHFMAGTIKTPELKGKKLSDLLRMATDDLKAYYLEAVLAQPGQPTDAQTLSDWFWGETCAAAVINEVRKSCLNNGAKDMLLTGKLLLIPRNQMYRFKEL